VGTSEAHRADLCDLRAVRQRQQFGHLGRLQFGPLFRRAIRGDALLSLGGHGTRLRKILGGAMITGAGGVMACRPELSDGGEPEHIRVGRREDGGDPAIRP
jgi:hypothetical protein